MNSTKNFTTPFLIVLLVVASFLLGTFWTKVQNIEKGTPSTQKVAGETTENPQGPTPTPKIEITDAEFTKLVNGATKIDGPDSAPIKIVEFSDFECPFCARFFEQTYPQIEEKYIKTGKAQLLFRHFPLSFHANAKPAAIAAECAAAQGKFQAMHNILYKNQDSLTDKDLKSYAGKIGLNQTTFDACLDGKATETRIDQDLKLGQEAGVTGTPAFFVNGKIISGAVPFNIFQQTLDSLL